MSTKYEPLGGYVTRSWIHLSEHQRLCFGITILAALLTDRDALEVSEKQAMLCGTLLSGVDPDVMYASRFNDGVSGAELPGAKQTLWEALLNTSTMFGLSAS